MKKNLFALVVMSFAILSAHAQVSQTGSCDPAATSCNGSFQTVGNNGSSATATNTTSSSSQSGNSANNNGASIAPVITANPQSNQSQTQGNATQSNTGGNTNGTITGGNTSSAANGNNSSNANNSSVGNTSATTGASTSNSGGNTLSTGASNSGGNRLVNGSNTATNTATGGAGGSGGAGGNATGGAGGKSQSASVANGSKQQQSNTGTNAQGQSSRNANTVSTGGASNGQVVGGSGNGTTAVNTGGNTANYSTVVMPDYPSTPPSMVGVGQITLATKACGPLEQAVPTDVVGTYFGFFKRTSIDLGKTWRTQPVYDESTHQRLWYNYVPMADGSTQVMGSQVTRAYSNESISGARSIGAMGGSGSNIGQIGGGSSAAMSQMVVDVQIDDCLIAIVPARHVEEVAPVVFTPYPNQTPVPAHHYHRRVKAACLPVKK